MFTAAVRPLRRIVAWPVTSQHGARRNALVASTALAKRRRERLDAEEFLTGYLEARARHDRVLPA